ncbi:MULTISPECIES: hypothetical protein [Pseudomonas]|jgi:hypothetical protein|uniref:hypothetical protein n=1 Tax=Pseudomonas TaxID=286 RepID=UPI0006D6C855|nr:MULTISPECIES: hypothetical protein [Pseudomonas]KPG97056.1 hypothetical protein AK821_11915 [Pseudomonas sp. RIT-PI-r]MCP1489190.1 hypothetical protein [Pseudomonas fluorescens]
MSYKRWRILIADEQRSLHVRIGKCLDELGYRGYASVYSFRELLGTTHYSSDPFEHYDLLIINAELIAVGGDDPLRFFQCNLQIRHAVIYDKRRGEAGAQAIYSADRRYLTLIRIPDRQTLGPLIADLATAQ